MPSNFCKALTIFLASGLISISHADNTEEHAQTTDSQEPNNSPDQAFDSLPTDVSQDPSAVTLEAMVISSDQPGQAFESIKLIKKNLGIATDGADILKQTPGISVTRQGGTASDPMLRGLGGTRLNISIDGVPFGGVCNHRMDPATAYISPGSFDSLILLKGPQSVTNGNNISGAVDFERDTPSYEEIGAKAYGSFLYGSFNQEAVSIDSSVGTEYGFLTYTHNNTSGDDYVDGDGNVVDQTFYDTSNDRGSIGFTPDDDTLIEFSGLTGKGVIGNATIHMDVTKLDRQNYDLHLQKNNINSWLASVDLRYNYTDVDHEMDNFSYRDPDFGHGHNVMSQFWVRNYAKAEFVIDINPELQLTSGVDYKNDNYEGRGAGGYAGGIPGIPADPAPDISQKPLNQLVAFDNFAAFSELNYQMTESLRWVSGFRVDTLGTDTGTMHAAGEISNIVLSGSNQHRRQTLFAGFLRSEYAAENLPLAMSAGYGHAERAADYWEVYSMDAFALNPEKNNEIDAIISYQAEEFTVELSAYYSYISDFILVKGGASALNIDAQRTGTELLTAYYVTDEVSLTGNLSYTYAQNLTQNTPLAQTPPLEGNIGIQYDDGVFYGSVNTRLVARQDRIHTGFGNTVALDTTPTAGFVTASLQLGYTPHPLVKFQFGIDNIFDKTYTEHLNRSAASAAGPALKKLIEPGRAYWGRITVDFDYPASFI